jgi:hypothetical protein
MKTLAQALTFLEKRQVMTLAGPGTGPVPSLSSEVAGKPIAGTWWAHPKGKLIFQLANELEDHPDVLLTKLVLGKVTFVHRGLWPALYRAATDADQRRVALEGVSRRAVDLFDRVCGAGSLQIGKADKKAAAELEALVIHAQEHGEKGAHLTVLRSWEDWAEPGVVKAAKKLTVASAREKIAEACGAGATFLAAAVD